MAADQERAERVRALKQSRPDLTWRRIGDYVGVSERAAIDWQKNGGMEYANAEKLAALFEVDVDYIWRGTQTDTPDLFAGDGSSEDRLARIELMLIEARQEQDRISRLVERALERLEDATSTAVRGMDAAVADFRAETERRQRTPRKPRRSERTGNRPEAK